MLSCEYQVLLLAADFLLKNSGRSGLEILATQSGKSATSSTQCRRAEPRNRQWEKEQDGTTHRRSRRKWHWRRWPETICVAERAQQFVVHPNQVTDAGSQLALIKGFISKYRKKNRLNSYDNFFMSFLRPPKINSSQSKPNLSNALSSLSICRFSSLRSLKSFNKFCFNA